MLSALCHLFPLVLFEVFILDVYQDVRLRISITRIISPTVTFLVTDKFPFWITCLQHLTSSIESNRANAPRHHYASFMALLWQQKHWYALQPIKRTPCMVCQGHCSTFNHQWLEMWERVSGSSWGHVFNNIMTLLLVTKQALVSSRSPSIEVIFNEKGKPQFLTCLPLCGSFHQDQIIISGGHLVRLI